MENINNQNKDVIVEKPETAEKKKKETLKKSLILGGIFAGLVLAMILTVVFVPRGINSLANVSLSSIFKGSDKIVLTVDKSDIGSGEQVMLKWNGAVRTDGSYTLTYPCKAGISAQFHSGEPMTCDTAFYFTSPDNTAAVKIFSTLDRDTDVPLYLNFKDNDGKTSLVGDILVTVHSASSVIGNIDTSTPSTPGNGIVVVSTSTVVTPSTNPTTTPAVTPKPTTTTPKPTPKPTKPVVKNTGVDLVVKIIAVGSINSNNTFTPGSSVPSGSRPAVRFEVVNTGTQVSGTWSFKITSPSPTTPVYTANSQPSLAHNDRVEYTFGFDNTTNGGNVVISVNENKTVTESNYSNNIYSYSVSGTSNPSTPVSTGAGKDLVVQFGAVGYMSNGTFVQSNNIPRTARAVVKFVITNTGKDYSGEYVWTAALPSSTDGSYTSNSQSSLAPGASIESTLAFDNIANAGNNTATVRVDVNNNVSETNENNNVASTVFYAY